MSIERLRAEISDIEHLLAKSSKSFANIGLQARLEDLREELLQLDAEMLVDSRPLRVLFGGRPVRGNEAIRSDFAGKILPNVETLIRKQAAIQVRRQPMSRMGKVPHANFDLEVRRIARGASVGFEFGLSAEQLTMRESHPGALLSEVVSVTVKLLSDISGLDEELYADAVLQLDPRIWVEVVKLFKTLRGNHATALVEGLGSRLDLDGSRVTRGGKRVSSTTRQHQRRRMIGRLSGALPHTGQFEFIPESDVESGSVVHLAPLTGSIDPDVEPARREQWSSLAPRRVVAVVSTHRVLAPDGRVRERHVLFDVDEELPEPLPSLL